MVFFLLLFSAYYPLVDDNEDFLCFWVAPQITASGFPFFLNNKEDIKKASCTVTSEIWPVSKLQKY